MIGRLRRWLHRSCAGDTWVGYRYGPDGKVIHPTCSQGHTYCPMGDAPHRRHVVTIMAMGDTPSEVARNLRIFADQYVSGMPYEVRPGTTINGQVIAHAFDDDSIDAQSYNQALDAYLDRKLTRSSGR